ncbi:MAG: hypothetical protein C4523_07840 [Myxococcales bacterium]|nr:MAG: hypothetical protein C4523_07840 [Myxococcales bacterium]
MGKRSGRLTAWVVAYAAAFILCGSALAQETGVEGPSNRQVGLGVLVGANFPFSNNVDYKITESWGFFVDIPIISTFHIAPSTTLYRLNMDDGSSDQGIADVSLNFRFVIPFPMWGLFFAAFLGTSYGEFVEGDVIQAHVGGNLGFTVRLVSNLDFIMLGQYKLLIDGNQSNVNSAQAMAGLQFNF